MHTCFFCYHEGREVELDEEWAEHQKKILPPGFPLACKDHKDQQQAWIRQQAAKEGTTLDHLQRVD